VACQSPNNLEVEMFTRRITDLLLIAVLITAVSGCSAIAKAHANHFHGQVTQAASDPISGEWDVTFRVDASTTPAVFTLKLEGEKVSGTVYSQHTGPGILRDGSWTNNKLSFTAEFEKHESIAVTGEVKGGGLAGEFRTEGFVSSWEAKRKAATVNASSAPEVKAKPGDPISGEWDANFAVAQQKVQFLLKLTLDGAKISGTAESANAGSGTITEGSLVNNDVAFTMPGPHGPVKVTGALKDGALAGDFVMGQIKGTWTAKRK
jgi:hypothetical protein